MDEIDSLRHRISELERELEDARRRNAELEVARGGTSEVGDLSVPISEFEETLRRLVQRTAMIVQSEKCVILVRDRETGDLVARSPAFGMSDAEVRSFRVRHDTGISGEVYRTCQPTIFEGLDKDKRIARELYENLRVRNGVTVPLLIEKRDEQNHLIDRISIGVLHCFNKRYSGQFNEEDVRLLERLSRNAAAVIANAQAYQEVVEEKQKLVHTLESLTAGLVLITHRGRIGQMNAQARAMFQVAPDTNPLGKPYDEVICHEECLAILRRKLAEAEAPSVQAPEKEEDGRQAPDEIAVVDEDEQYVYQVHSASVRDDADQPIGTVVIFNDVTDIRNVERMKTEFVSIVSHELRTPLTPMKGFVRTLLDDENEEWYTREDRREFYGIIDANVDRLRRLIDDLLNVSRIEKKGVEGIEMNFEPVDLRKAAEDVVLIQRGMVDKHNLVLDFEPEHINAEADPDKIQNILQNLVSNGIKYSPEGGEVRVIARLESERESVLFGVKDQGMGIPEAAQKKLFTKFFRVDNKNTRKVGGTGIGLFLVRNLVAAHHGEIWVDSVVGEGTTVWFRIPMVQPKSEMSDAEDGHESAPQQLK